MKTTISENQLKRLISESIKKNILNENFKVDFQQLGRPSKNPNFDFNNPIFLSNGSTAKPAFDSLSKGTYGNGANLAYRTLLNMGYTPEQLNAAIQNRVFAGTTNNAQMRLETYATNKQGAQNLPNAKRAYVQGTQETQQNVSGYYNPNQAKKETNSTTTGTVGTPTSTSTEPEKKGAEPGGIQSGVNNWNALGLIEQIRLIQKAIGLSGADADGRVGPQTTASIVRALINNNSTIVQQLAQKNIGVQSFTDKNLQFARGKKTAYNQPIDV